MLSGGSDPAAGESRPDGAAAAAAAGTGPGGNGGAPPPPRPCPPRPLIGCGPRCVSALAALRQWGRAAAAAKARVYNKRRRGGARP